MFTLVSLSIIKNSLDDIENRKDRGENFIQKNKQKNAIFMALLSLFIISAFSGSYYLIATP